MIKHTFAGIMWFVKYVSICDILVRKDVKGYILKTSFKILFNKSTFKILVPSDKEFLK